MKRISYIFITLLAFVGLSLLIGTSGCQHDKCAARDIQCQNDGFCRDGECLCVNGWEGDSCQSPMNEKFASHYAMIRTELINGTVNNDNDDTLVVTAAGAGDRYGISFYSIRNPADVWTATVLETEVSIPYQQVDISNYSGHGSLSGNVLTLTMFRETPATNTSSKITYVGYQYDAP